MWGIPTIQFCWPVCDTNYYFAPCHIGFKGVLNICRSFHPFLHSMFIECLDFQHHRLVWSPFKLRLSGWWSMFFLVSGFFCCCWWDSPVCGNALLFLLCHCVDGPWCIVLFYCLGLILTLPNSAAVNILIDVFCRTYVHILKWHHELHCLFQSWGMF